AFELAEGAALAVAGQREQLLLGGTRLACQRGGDVAAELAVDQRRDLRLGERLQALLDAPLLGGRLLEGTVAEQQPGEVRVDTDRVHVTTERASREPVDEPHEGACLAG